MWVSKNKVTHVWTIYWANINTDIEKHIKNCTTCLEFQQTQPKEKILHHDIPLRPWEVLGVDLFHFNNKNYLCIVDYHSKFPVIKGWRVCQQKTSLPQQRSYMQNMAYHASWCQMLVQISFQIGSDRSAAAWTLSKQCHQHTTIKVMDRLMPASNS